MPQVGDKQQPLSLGAGSPLAQAAETTSGGTLGQIFPQTRQKQRRESLCTTGSGAGQGTGLGKKSSLPVLLHHMSPAGLF